MHIRSSLRAFFGVVALAVGAPAMAAESWHQDFVKTVYPLSNGNFIITFVSSPSSCTNANNPKYFHVQVGHNGVTIDGAKAMLATTLMAFASGKRLTVAFDDTSYACDVNRMTISD